MVSTIRSWRESSASQETERKWIWRGVSRRNGRKCAHPVATFISPRRRCNSDQLSLIVSLQCKECGSGRLKLSVIIASSPKQREDVYRQRYDAYAHERAIDPNQEQTFTDQYDDLATSILIAVTEESDTVVGSLRFSVQPPPSHDSAQTVSCPEFLIFSEVLQQLSADDRPIASGSRFSIRHDHKQRSKISILLMLAQIQAAQATGAQWGIATARGTHLNFYERLLLMKPIGSERRMPGLNYDYQLLASNLDDNYHKALKRFPSKIVAEFAAANPHWNESVRSRLRATGGFEFWLPSL